MKRLLFFKLAGRDVHMPRLIGAFILFASVLMFVSACAEMFDSWDNMKHFEKCVLSSNNDEAEYNECRLDLYYNTGTYVHDGQGKFTGRQFWTTLLTPIAGVLFWLAILFVGWLLYKTGDLVIPIEQTVKDSPHRVRRKRK